jgi:hypothetical protein
MRPRKQIETEYLAGNPLEPLTLEVLLDMRDLLARSKRQSAILSEA